MLVLAAAQEPESGTEWGYKGAINSKAWGTLSPTFAMCKLGHQQSPIDIRDAKKEALPPLQFDYKSVPLKIFNEGHSIQVVYPPGSFLTAGDKKYELRQFHFHHPSEEHINGKASDMAIHLVHADSEGHLSVLVVLLKRGSANGILQKVWDNIPTTVGKTQDVPGAEINATSLLPQTTGYYTFQGSLTTPPCSEGVTWFVLKTPVEISKEEVAAFGKFYPHNARPIQPTGGRTILESQ